MVPEPGWNVCSVSGSNSPYSERHRVGLVYVHKGQVQQIIDKVRWSTHGSVVMRLCSTMHRNGADSSGWDSPKVRVLVFSPSGRRGQGDSIESSSVSARRALFSMLASNLLRRLGDLSRVRGDARLYGIAITLLFLTSVRAKYEAEESFVAGCVQVSM